MYPAQKIENKKYKCQVCETSFWPNDGNCPYCGSSDVHGAFKYKGNARIRINNILTKLPKKHRAKLLLIQGNDLPYFLAAVLL